jgi:hypothetical protein
MSLSLRVFVVGCARSGTTLLHSCLGAHPRVFARPESRLLRTARAASAWADRLGLATSTAAERLRPIYAELGLDPTLPRRHLFLRSHVRDFFAAFDRACLAEGRDVWVEKTPDHLREIPRLRRWLPDARFLHILRDGFDNVCALVDVTRRHPAWGPRPWTVEESARRWCEDLDLSLAQVGRPGHLLVRLADLTARPEPVLRAVDAFLGLDFHPAQLRGDAAKVIPARETWKAAVGEGIQPPNPDRYRDFLPAAEAAALRARLAPWQARLDALPSVDADS